MENGEWARLKELVREKGRIVDAVYHYPYTYIAWEYRRATRRYHGVGFAKYSTEDMATIHLPYSVDRGHEIAEGRAIAHCARRVLEHEIAAGIRLDDILGNSPTPEPVFGMPAGVAS